MSNGLSPEEGEIIGQGSPFRFGGSTQVQVLAVAFVGRKAKDLLALVLGTKEGVSNSMAQLQSCLFLDLGRAGALNSVFPKSGDDIGVAVEGV